jgi:hypothetical protein
MTLFIIGASPQVRRILLQQLNEGFECTAPAHIRYQRLDCPSSPAVLIISFHGFPNHLNSFLLALADASLLSCVNSRLYILLLAPSFMPRAKASMSSAPIHRRVRQIFESLFQRSVTRSPAFEQIQPLAHSGELYEKGQRD